MQQCEERKEAHFLSCPLSALSSQLVGPKPAQWERAAHKQGTNTRTHTPTHAYRDTSTQICTYSLLDTLVLGHTRTAYKGCSCVATTKEHTKWRESPGFYVCVCERTLSWKSVNCVGISPTVRLYWLGGTTLEIPVRSCSSQTVRWNYY